jgi:hypothetical protein
MKKFITFFTLALSVVVLIALTTSTTIAATKTDSDYQRYITFHNDFDFPIYPVIQVPMNNCVDQDTRVRRIIINGPSNDGLQPNETLTVLIPNEKDTNNNPTVTRCWYKSGRIYIFPVKLSDFEKQMVEVYQSNSDQTTNYNDPTFPSQAVICFEGKRNNQGNGSSGNCKTGIAKNSFAADVPAQLAEYTFDSDNGTANGDPDTGIAMADIDVSHVDDLYLPVAASVVNNGATGYMGGAMDLPTFQQRFSSFFTTAPWPKYSAYLSQFQVKANNALYGLLPPALVEGADTPAPHLPAGYNSIQNTLSKAISSIYKTDNSAENYLISGVNNEATQVDPYIKRWMFWINQNGQPCSSNIMSQITTWPDGITSSFNKQNFCNQFSATVNAVWTHFSTDKTDGYNNNKTQFQKDCGLINSTPDQNQINACIIQHIVGYNSKVLGGELPGQVQALLRGVAYNSADGIDPNNKQYQYDPFLTFAAPYNSQFNLNPYTRLIHSTTDGVGAVAYSFSIDDKYGNFRDASLGIVVDAGGTSALDNQKPYDPYQQYSLDWGYNRDKFSLISVAPSVNLANVQNQLKAIADNNSKQPFLIKQGQNIAVFGHTDATGNNWQLISPLVTLTQLKTLAQQEYERYQTTSYQDLINYTFGASGVDSIFPKTPWNGNNQNSPSINVLDFDVPSKWPAGQARLDDFVSQQNADVPTKGNWVSADASKCGIPNLIQINAPGSQRLPIVKYINSTPPCQITLKDTFGEIMAFTLTPESKQVQDKYTGARVSVTSLTIGNTFSGSPQTTSNLGNQDLQNCQTNSSNQRIAGLCNNITLSAVWSADPLSRDVVYMGLDPKDMPRVNVNLPAAPSEPIDPNVVNWPSNATMTFQLQNDGTVLVSWPAALSGSNNLQYLLYLQNGSNWTPQTCDQSQTSCSLKLGASARLYVIAVNNAVSPPSQTPQLFGCYPAANPCPPTTGKPTKTRPPKR